MHLLHTSYMPIQEQLYLEEALLRADTRDFCLINIGSPRSIVVGLSGEPHEWVHLDKAFHSGIPVIKRYSGGGTVIVDANTLFITFICSEKNVPITPFPESILRWSVGFYQEAWPFLEMQGLENDYVLAGKKCGGNAQYIQRGRWMHHTSFLWDYSEESMGYLKTPPRAPTYRAGRSHAHFLERLNRKAESLDQLVFGVKETLVRRFGKIHEVTLASLADVLERPHRRSSHLHLARSSYRAPTA